MERVLTLQRPKSSADTTTLISNTQSILSVVHEKETFQRAKGRRNLYGLILFHS